MAVNSGDWYLGMKKSIGIAAVRISSRRSFVNFSRSGKKVFYTPLFRRINVIMIDFRHSILRKIDFAEENSCHGSSDFDESIPLLPVNRENLLIIGQIFIPEFVRRIRN